MHLHEYQTKDLFSAYGISVPPGKHAASVEEAVHVAQDLGSKQWMVKAQVHAGGRGKAGGVKCVDSLEAVRSTAERLLGSHLVTEQTTQVGLPVNTVLIEQTCAISHNYYIGMTIDRAHECITFIVSTEGGMEIEDIVHSHPEKMLTVRINPFDGLQSLQCEQIVTFLKMDKAHESELNSVLQGLYRLFIDKDASLLEINPLVITNENKLMALDGKLVIDENALYRQPELMALRDVSQEDEKEHTARQFGLNYITLEGNIACMVNGAGLAMATMDLIKLHGGEPANFLDVGGGTTADKVAEAFKLILSDPKIKAILVNIFGGIVRCDLIAEGIIAAVKDVGIHVPVVVRLEGTNANKGRALLNESRLNIITAQDLADAATKAVEAARA